MEKGDAPFQSLVLAWIPPKILIEVLCLFPCLRKMIEIAKAVFKL